ncbi:MAG: hypothetical protein Q6J78_00655 [Thermostichales cyanobacterium SRBZ-1_bins_19]
MRPPRFFPWLILSLLFGSFLGFGFILGFLLGKRPSCRRRDPQSEPPAAPAS